MMEPVMGPVDFAAGLFTIQTEAGPRAVKCPDEHALRALEVMAAHARIGAEGRTFYYQPMQRDERGRTVSMPPRPDEASLRITVWSATGDAVARAQEIIERANRYEALHLVDGSSFFGTKVWVHDEDVPVAREVVGALREAADILARYHGIVWFRFEKEQNEYGYRKRDSGYHFAGHVLIASADDGDYVKKDREDHIWRKVNLSQLAALGILEGRWCGQFWESEQALDAWLAKHAEAPAHSVLVGRGHR